jgi:hypothetical protein
MLGRDSSLGRSQFLLVEFSRIDHLHVELVAATLSNGGGVG